MASYYSFEIANVGTADEVWEHIRSKVAEFWGVEDDDDLNAVLGEVHIGAHTREGELSRDMTGNVEVYHVTEVVVRYGE